MWCSVMYSLHDASCPTDAETPKAWQHQDAPSSLIPERLRPSEATSRNQRHTKTLHARWPLSVWQASLRSIKEVVSPRAAQKEVRHALGSWHQVLSTGISRSSDSAPSTPKFPKPLMMLGVKCCHCHSATAVRVLLLSFCSWLFCASSHQPGTLPSPPFPSPPLPSLLRRKQLSVCRKRSWSRAPG